jgi:hypothetical protein
VLFSVLKNGISLGIMKGDAESSDEVWITGIRSSVGYSLP